MLDEYKKEHARRINQYMVVNLEGKIETSDNTLFKNLTNKHIEAIHPFFTTLTPLLVTKDEEFIFSCINISINNLDKTVDVFLKTFSKDKLPLLIIQDLTTHYKSYQTTAQIRNEAVIDSQILELQNEYLKEKEAFKNTFIANFSHELRDPLTGIITFSDILKKTNLNPDQENYIKVLDSSSNHLRKMIDDILDISKIEAGKLELIIEPFNIKELLDDLKAIFKAKANNKSLEFKSNFNDNLPEIVSGDALRLRQVLSNLLDNAIKFTTEGSITFSASLNQIRAQKASIHFSITDTGIGISKEDIEKIFTSFTQLNNPQTYKGAGLGLAIANYLVNLTKSNISVNSTIGQGSTFSTNVNFLVNPKRELTEKTIPKTRQKRNKKHNILLVEDSEITQLAVLKILASQGNYFLDIISNPNDVVEKIENSEFDLVLLDIKLHDQFGDDIAKIIRKLPEREHKRVPILALTAKVFKEDLKRYKKAGINGVVKKPFDENTLLDAIESHLK